MRTDRKLYVLASIALIALIVAVFAFREAIHGPSRPVETSDAADPSHPSTIPSADEAQAKRASKEVDYFPLTDAFRQTFLVEVTYLGENPRFGIATLAVQGREKIRDKEYFKLVLQVTGIPEMRDPVLRYCRKSDSAWHELVGPKSESPIETITLPLPPRTELTWDRDTPDERSNWKIEGAETVVLLGKEYPECLRIAYERRLKQETDYFETGHYLLAPNAGLIKQVVRTAGARITFTLDHRPPEDLQFYTTWSGTYKAVAAGKSTGGLVQLSADGRYTVRRSIADSALETGTFKRDPAKEGEMILQSDAGQTSTYSLRRSQAPSGRTLLSLKSLSGSDLPWEEYQRDAPTP